MVNFTANIFKLSLDFKEMVLSLGFNPHIYKVVPRKNKYNFSQQPFYQESIRRIALGS